MRQERSFEIITQGSVRLDDLVKAFSREVHSRHHGEYQCLIDEANDWLDEPSNEIDGSVLCARLENALHDLAPVGQRFGTHPDNETLFAFFKDDTR